MNATEKPADAILVIDARAKQYADQRAVLDGHLVDYNLELEALRKKHLPAIRKAAARCADLQDNLQREIAARPDLFVQPRTITLEPERLWLRDRRADATLARQVAIYCLRRLTPLKLAQIGEPFDRTHGDVLSAVKAVKDRRDTEPLFATELKRLVSECALALD